MKIDGTVEFNLQGILGLGLYTGSSGRYIAFNWLQISEQQEKNCIEQMST